MREGVNINRDGASASHHPEDNGEGAEGDRTTHRHSEQAECGLGKTECATNEWSGKDVLFQRSTVHYPLKMIATSTVHFVTATSWQEGLGHMCAADNTSPSRGNPWKMVCW